MIVPILLFFLAFLIFFIVISSHYPKVRTVWLLRQVPTAETHCRLPFLGMTFDLLFLPDAELFDYFKFLFDQRPELIKTYLAGIPLVLINSPQSIETVLSSTKHIQKGVEYRPFGSWLGEGLLLSSSVKWARRRKLLTPAFHFKILEGNVKCFNENAELLVEKLLQRGHHVDIWSLVSHCTLDVISESAMGISLKTQSSENEEYLKAIKFISKECVHRMKYPFLRHDWLYSNISQGKDFFRYTRLLHSFSEKVIQRRRELVKSNFSRQSSDSDEVKPKLAFLDNLIRMNVDHAGALSDRDIREEVDTFMFEGHDTTSAAVSFAIYCIGLYPEVQEKTYEEQFDIFGYDYRPATRPDLARMSYLEKVIKETLRLYPSVPYFSRFLENDITIDGFVVPAESNIVIQPYLLHRRPELYSDPEQFDPERFSAEEIAKRHPFAYIPFSAGPRNCIGQKFAMMEMKTILSLVIRRCKITSITSRKDFKCLPFVIIKPNVPLIVNVVPRKRDV